MVLSVCVWLNIFFAMLLKTDGSRVFFFSFRFFVAAAHKTGNGTQHEHIEGGEREMNKY
jgi:hypothetical protein